MSKKSTKVLSGALATSLALGAMPVFADTSVDYDALYAVANEAALKAQKEGTQEAITAARTAIKPLLDAYNAGEEWLAAMVGTLSSMVDEVQQKLFNDFYAMIYDVVDGKPVLKETLTQAEIDEARDYVLGFKTYEGNAEYINTWSAAVDAFQQKKYDAAYAAVEKAEKSQLQEDIDAAQKLMDELATSKNAEVAKWVTDVQAKLDAVEAIEVLKVESVSAINDLKSKELTVTGKVTKPAELLGGLKADITVNKIDDKGEATVQTATSVLSLDKKDGSFKQSINTNAYTAGNYQVVITASAGIGEEAVEVEVTKDFTIDKVELEAINKVVDAVNKSVTQLQLEEALNAPEFVGVDAELLIQYDAALSAKPYATVKAIQTVIDNVNKGQNETAEVKAIVDAAKLNDQKTLLSALNKATLEVTETVETVEVTRVVTVDSKNLADYALAIRTSETATKIDGKADNVATIVDKVNKIKETAKAESLNVSEVNALVTTLKLELAKELVDTDPSTPITNVEDAVKAYNLAVTKANEAIVKYNAAVASAQEYRELDVDGALDNTGAVNIALAAVKVSKENLDKELTPALPATAKVTADIGTKTAALLATDANGIGNKTDGGLLKTVETAKAAAKANADRTAALADYKALAKRADALELVKGAGVYKTADDANIALVAKTTGFTSELTALEEANEVLENIVDLNEGIKAKDVAKVEKALIALNVDYAAASAKYADLPKANRNEVAVEFIEATTALVDTVAKADLQTVYTAYAKKISDVTAAVLNSTMKTALENVVGEDVVITLEQAEAFINNFPKDEDGARVAYKTLAAIKAAIN